MKKIKNFYDSYTIVLYYFKMDRINKKYKKSLRVFFMYFAFVCIKLIGVYIILLIGIVFGIVFKELSNS